MTDFNATLANIRQFNATARGADPFGKDHQVSNLMINTCEDVIAGKFDESDIIVQQMVAWANHRGLVAR